MNPQFLHSFRLDTTEVKFEDINREAARSSPAAWLASPSRCSKPVGAMVADSLIPWKPQIIPNWLPRSNPLSDED